MPAALDALLVRLADIHNLGQAGAVLNWDQRTYMPVKGAEARARQLATIAKLTHNMFVAQETQDLLASSEADQQRWGPDSDERAMLRVVRRSMDKATKVPTKLVVEMAETFSLAEDVWQKARAENDFKTFAPWLERVVKLRQEYAGAIGYKKRIYDALLDDYEEGMTADELDPLFAELKEATVPLVAAIQQHADKASDEPLTRDFDEAGQQAFATKILKDCGFSFERGRLDVSVHPFCTNFSQNDVRITTRYERDWLPGALFGCMHEMGHAFYELNVNPKYEATPLSGGVSLGVHESQSRLWENLVGRSKAFWERYYPDLQATFPQLKNVGLSTFYKSINRVKPSLIRVEADEVTYNLHIILRYEMEQALLEGKVSVHDAPATWNEKMKASLGIVPPTDREGILQDVHWSGGGIGYFPTYTLGNILAAQLFDCVTRQLPNIENEIRAGQFSALYEWLRVNVHQYGSKYPPRELVKKATGKPLGLEAYLQYLKKKFSDIYELSR